MIDHRTIISAFRNPARRAVEIYVHQRLVGGKVAIVDSITWKTESDGFITEPSFTIDDESATELLQSLWDQGFRPRNYEGTGTIEALKYHLEDMRRIVFDKLERPHHVDYKPPLGRHEE